MLDDNRLTVNGWVSSSYNVSTAARNNQPVVWSDRANEPLINQTWLRVGRSVVTSGTTEPTFGFQFDAFYGTDYRFTLPRGLLNGQLQNSDGVPNLYGVDLVQHYLCGYFPSLFAGTEIRVGRLYTPWGVESIESPSTPLISRSYAFNWAPPFTHCGIGAYITFNKNWSAVLMAANGNDVYFFDPAEEWRFVGNVKYTSPNGRDTVTLATSLGRGKFNAGEPYAAATPSLPNEPLGRNNINVFDIVWTHTFNPTFSYALEGIYGYQTNVPGLLNSTGYGTATWASLAQFLFVNFSPSLSGVVSVEAFDDFQGQRTGFEGLYLSGIVAMTYKFRKDLILDFELRYDNNIESRPFEGKHDILTASVDLTLHF